MSSTKEKVKSLLSKLPDDCSLEDIQYHLYVLEKVRQGLEIADANASNLNEPSETNWTKIDEMTDETIDTSDIPPLDETFFAKAKLRKPKSKAFLTVSVDSDVLEWFQAQGEDFERRINAALRIYAEAHKQK